MTESETPIEEPTGKPAAPEPAAVETPVEVDAEPAPDAGQAALQDAYDTAAEQGFYGEPVDDKPNDHYTFPGPVAEEPNHETSEGTDAQ